MRMKSKALAGLLSVTLTVGLSPVSAFADLEQKPEGSSTWAQLLSTYANPDKTDHATGAYAPQTPVYSVHDQNYSAPRARAVVPSRYSSVEEGRVTPVVDQGRFGTCWAFSTVAAAESSILTKGLASSVDLSERHLAYFTYHPQSDPLGGTTGDGAKALEASYSSEFEGADDLYLATGGNCEMTMHALSSWSGAADESLASYKELQESYDGVGWSGDRAANLNKFLADTALPGSMAFQDSYHLENGYMIAMKDRGDVKQAIMDHGAVAASFDADESPQYFNEDNSTFYNPDSTTYNHLVVVVGWDDDFSATKFSFDSGWSDQAKSASYLTGESAVATLDSQGVAWLRYEPAASGFYNVSVPSDYGIDYTADCTVFKLDESSGTPLWVNKTGSYSSSISDCYLDDGTTYFIKTKRRYGDKAEYSVKVTPSTGFLEVPSNAVQVQVGQKASLDPAPAQWLAFTPEKTGAYSATIEGADTARAYLFCENPCGEDGKLMSRGELPDGSVQLQAGQTYYFQCFVAGSSAEFLVNLEEEKTAVNGDPVFTPFDREADATRPSKNGAWLCKNSWGSDWGDDGYFWLSYEDACLNTDEARAYVYDMAPADNYDNNYQYDGSPAPYYNVLPSGGSIANVFTAKANANGAEELKAVGIALYDVNVDYSVQVYVNPTDDANPTSGSPALAQPATGRLIYGGFHTIDLPKSVSLQEGERFAVVMTLSHANGAMVNYGVDTTTSAGYVQFTNACEKGQSLSLYPKAATWYDLSGKAQDSRDESGATARIKAFTANTASASTSISIADADVKVTGIVDSADGKKPNVSVTYGGALLAEGKQYSLTSKFDASSNTFTITVTGLGDYSGTKTITHQSAPTSQPTTPDPSSPGTKPDSSSSNTKPGTSSSPGSGTEGTKPNATASTQVMLRLYNPNSGEHFYTSSQAEKDNAVKAGWKYEGKGWTAPKTSKTPVYRLYSGTDHHYTTSAAERDQLKKVGWKYEGIGWYSDDAKGVPLHRVFNPNVQPNAPRNNSGSHHYTTSKGEADSLVRGGWRYENIGWYGVK